MKRNILCGIALVAGLMSCTEDFTDWSAPQTNAQGEVAEKSTLEITPTATSLDFTSITTETIQLFTASLAAESYLVTLTTTGSDNKATVVADAEGNVDTAEMLTAVSDVAGGGADEKTVNVTVSAKVPTKTADGTISASKEAQAYTITAKLPAGSIIDSEPVLYLTGNNYGWGATWVPLVPIHSNPTMSWIIIYLHENEEFKFAPQTGWVNDFGYTDNMVDNAGANITNSGGNIKVGTAGWYLIKVDNTDGNRTVEFQKPNIYLIGETSPAGWSTEESGLFTIPESENGIFVSPEFVKSNDLRICVKLVDDWWKTEFTVKNGQIDFRGAAKDQEPRTGVTQGKRCYLNFKTGAGSFK